MSSRSETNRTPFTVVSVVLSSHIVLIKAAGKPLITARPVALLL